MDYSQGTTAVLLLESLPSLSSGHSGVVEIYRVETDPVITGGSSQCYLVLRRKILKRPGGLASEPHLVLSPHGAGFTTLTVRGQASLTLSTQCVPLQAT